MEASFYQILFFLLVGVGTIIFLTARLKVHPFFALVLASFIVGLGCMMSFLEVVNAMKEGIGNILKSLALIIVLGTTLGVILQQTGATLVMASTILKVIGKKHAALSMSLAGFIVGLPIFCDSGFIVMNGLNLSLARQTGVKVIVMTSSLATGLYAVHCLIPPHPGAAAAAGIIHVDFGRLMLIGIVLAVPAMIVGYVWSVYAGNKIGEADAEKTTDISSSKDLPAPILAFLPVLVPILLIGVRSFLASETSGSILIRSIQVMGDPVMALTIGVLLAMTSIRGSTKEKVSTFLQEAAEKAGGILVIIGAGGAFGSVLAATHLGKHFSESLPLGSMGILFPFLLTFVLKTAQGSSTVAIITASTIILPLLPALGLDTETGRLTCVLSMGAGSMMISHANDAYFWVISKFAGVEMKSMLRVYSVATMWMGLTTLLMVYIASFII